MVTAARSDSGSSSPKSKSRIFRQVLVGFAVGLMVGLFFGSSLWAGIFDEALSSGKILRLYCDQVSFSHADDEDEFLQPRGDFYQSVSFAAQSIFANCNYATPTAYAGFDRHFSASDRKRFEELQFDLNSSQMCEFADQMRVRIFPAEKVMELSSTQLEKLKQYLDRKQVQCRVQQGDTRFHLRLAKVGERVVVSEICGTKCSRSKEAHNFSESLGSVVPEIRMVPSSDPSERTLAQLHPTD